MKTNVDKAPSMDDDSRTKSRKPLTLALLSAALLWFSFPPVGIWPLAWLALIPLLHLVQVEQLPGARPYRQLFLAGFVYWLVTFYFVPIPHWGLFIGWLVISCYLAFYTPFFVAAARAMVHRFKVPFAIAVPVAFTGTEWIRCHLFSGQPLVCLSHSQFKQPLLIQVSDLFGAYTLTFAMTLFTTFVLASGIIPWFRKPGTKPRILQLVFAGVVMAVTLGYGYFRIDEPVQKFGNGYKAKVAIIQGSIDTELSARESELEKKFEQYCELTKTAREKWSELDLVVWPESNLPTLDVLPEVDLSSLPFDEQEAIESSMYRIWFEVLLPRDFGPARLLAGTGSLADLDGEKVYVSALFLDEKGNVSKRYFKNHLVMYGEYFPILEWIPGFSNLFGGFEAGTEPVPIEINGIIFAPNICFESTVPHVIRRHVNKLTLAGKEPDALINMTNDGWFFGTSCLDFHLACNVFRAVEMRKPNLVCANTGFSAEIDSAGRLIQVGPRRDTGIYRVEMVTHRRFSLYRLIGEWIPFGMAIGCVILVGWSCFRPQGQALVSPSSQTDGGQN